MEKKMEIQFGDIFKIQKRHDTGAQPFIRVTKIKSSETIHVQDAFSARDTQNKKIDAPGEWGEKSRSFSVDRLVYWKRWTANKSLQQTRADVPK